jgi:hypothetical protein
VDLESLTIQVVPEGVWKQINHKLDFSPLAFYFGLITFGRSRRLWLHISFVQPKIKLITQKCKNEMIPLAIATSKLAIYWTISIPFNIFIMFFKSSTMIIDQHQISLPRTEHAQSSKKKWLRSTSCFSWSVIFNEVKSMKFLALFRGS